MRRFKNPVFKPGINLTVRRGIKTVSHDTDTGHGNYIYNYIYTDRLLPVGFANVQYVKHMRFVDIDDDLPLVHDPALRDYDALLCAMKRYYTHFDCSEIVTLFFFTVNLFQEDADPSGDFTGVDDDGDEIVFL